MFGHDFTPPAFGFRNSCDGEGGARRAVDLADRPSLSVADDVRLHGRTNEFLKVKLWLNYEFKHTFVSRLTQGDCLAMLCCLHCSLCTPLYPRCGTKRTRAFPPWRDLRTIMF
ncbi:unnamed protein product [Sphacelaria rigidula]